MRFRGVHHVEFSVLDYDRSIAFYDRMFGWLGYTSFWTMKVEYYSTYYVARFPLPHSYIGIQPAAQGERLDHAAHSTGIHHIAIWARSRREVNRFHQQFLVKEGIPVTDPPKEHAVYAPGYYAVCFTDPTGIRWELAHMPRLPTPAAVWRTLTVVNELRRQHPEWKHYPAKEMMRALPSRRDLMS